MVSPTKLDWIQRCETQIGYVFANKKLLDEALTHASSSGSRIHSNERMEFLGDAVLGFTVCAALYERFTEWLEGDLTQIKSILVSRKTCAKISRQLGLQQFLFLGKGVSRGQTVPLSLAANVFESIIAAIYLDSGLEAARQFVLRHMEAEITAAVAGELDKNHKASLQHICQKSFGESPTYVLIQERGPEHAKQFLVQVLVSQRRFTPAWGASKKVAEQKSAANAMAELRDEDPPYAADRSESLDAEGSGAV